MSATATVAGVRRDALVSISTVRPAAHTLTDAIESVERERAHGLFIPVVACPGRLGEPAPRRR